MEGKEHLHDWIDQIWTVKWVSSSFRSSLSFHCTYIWWDVHSHILHITPICAHKQIHIRTQAHTPCPLPWRPSLDKRKTALSQAAVQLFSVVKHVCVWQSKLLFRFAVPDTDRAFKIWGEASRHCFHCWQRYRQLFTPVCVPLFTNGSTNAYVFWMQIVVFCFCVWQSVWGLIASQ